MSVEAPGAKATKRVTGLALGQSLWADALTHKNAVKAAVARALNAGSEGCVIFITVSCLFNFLPNKTQTAPH